MNDALDEANLSSRATDDAAPRSPSWPLMAKVALFLAQRIPTVQPGQKPREGAARGEPEPAAG